MCSRPRRRLSRLRCVATGSGCWCYGALRLAAVTRPPLGSTPTARIAPAATVVTLVDIALTRSAGRAVPTRVTNRIQYAIPPDAPAPVVDRQHDRHGTPPARTDQRAPVVIAPPLRGSMGAVSTGAAAIPPLHIATLSCRRTGPTSRPEIFAINWIRLVDGRLYTGDGTQNSDWPGYGAPLYAVADGTVVSTVPTTCNIIPPLAVPNLGGPGLRGQQRLHQDRAAPVRGLCAPAARFGPREAWAARPDRADYRPAREQREHDRAPPALSGFRNDSTPCRRANYSRSTATRWKGPLIWRPPSSPAHRTGSVGLTPADGFGRQLACALRRHRQARELAFAMTRQAFNTQLDHGDSVCPALSRREENVL